MDTPGRGMSHISGGRERDDTDFITLLRMVLTLKLINCLFCNFPFNIFSMVDKSVTVENHSTDKVRTTE